MKRRLLAGCVLGGALAILLGQGAMASVPYDPDYELRAAGLATDAPTLLSYLREGLPEGLALSDGRPLPADQRWGKYGHVVNALGKMKSPEAPPILIGLLEGPLPPKLATDLELSAADRFPDEEYEIVSFQSRCAVALRLIGDPSAAPALTRYVERLLPLMKIKAETPLYPPYTSAFANACVALGDLGSTAGIAFTVAALPDVPLDDPWAARTLRVLTGQPFGPQYGHPARVARRECAKWTAWWDASKATYQIDPNARLHRSSATGYVRDMKTVRDYVHQAPLARWGKGQPSLSRNGPEAVEWLAQNGAAHIKELAALVNDPDETVGVRNEAMVWYARFGGRKAMKTLAKYVRYEVPFDPEDSKLQHAMASEAFLIIKDTSPKLASRLGKEIIKDGSTISGFWAFDAVAAQDKDAAYRLAERHLFASDMYVSAASVATLMQRPDGVQKVLQSYAQLGDYAKREAISRLAEQPEPVGKEILFEAVKSSDRSIAGEAKRAILIFELYDELPQDSRQAMDNLTP